MKSGQNFGHQRLTLCKQLLSAGVSLAEIAVRLRCHRKTVERIAAGQHAQQRNPQFTRCHGCGGLVIMPCRLCGVRQLPAAG